MYTYYVLPFIIIVLLLKIHLSLLCQQDNTNIISPCHVNPLSEGHSIIIIIIIIIMINVFTDKMDARPTSMAMKWC